MAPVAPTSTSRGSTCSRWSAKVSSESMIWSWAMYGDCQRQVTVSEPGGAVQAPNSSIMADRPESEAVSAVAKGTVSGSSASRPKLA